MVYIDDAIDRLIENLVQKALKSSTPKKYAGDMYEAAEVIQQLRKEKAESEKWLPWVSVEDKLPDTVDNMVLVVATGKPAENILLESAVTIGSYCTDEKAWFIEAWPDWEDAEVSYWTPLPEPPEET